MLLGSIWKPIILLYMEYTFLIERYFDQLLKRITKRITITIFLFFVMFLILSLGS